MDSDHLNGNPGENVPSVSFIIATDSQTRFLPDVLCSVLQQSVQDVEVVIVADDSGQDLLAKLGDLARDSRVRYVRQEGRDISVARNTGLKESRGALVSFLDPEYWLVPKFCERLQSQLDADENLAIAYCDLLPCWDSIPGEHAKDRPAGESRIRNANILPPLLANGLLHQFAVLVRRTALEAVGLFDSELDERADRELWLRIVAAGHGVKHVDARLAYYRWHADSRLLRQMRPSSAEALRKMLLATPDGITGHQVTELDRARMRIEWLEETAAWFQRSAHSWQVEAERLKDVAARFENYFNETQAWMVSLQEAKRWHEEQAEHWRREAERRAKLPTSPE